MPLYAPSVIIPIYAVFTAIGIILTLLRFYVRTSVSRNAHSRNPFGLDDLFISIGLLITLTCSAIQFYNATNSNQGKAYTSAMKAPQRIIGMRIEFAMTVIEKPAFGAIKLSLLFFYRRIFGHWPSFQKVNNALVVIIVIWVMGFVFADLFICGSHLEYYYALNQALGKAHCGSKGLALVLFAFTSVITDLFVVSLPLFYIRRLQLRRSKRIAACVVFLLGGV
ncbi:hypothetical protein EJ04DRAFT_517402 [Polyplosphaeria fusca]|uniref:Rhodopsin domain-containing protein n=1 Tax=Polyplosphaeria fusca TaxID=682080 RepID=A0A9P4QH71_9PLEO|nr:hypothetical protein EJ04DRAFT_517402 [Polyplosphaeria fusca]